LSRYERNFVACVVSRQKEFITQLEGHSHYLRERVQNLEASIAGMRDRDNSIFRIHQEDKKRYTDRIYDLQNENKRLSEERGDYLSKNEELIKKLKDEKEKDKLIQLHKVQKEKAEEEKADREKEIAKLRVSAEEREKEVNKMIDEGEVLRKFLGTQVEELNEKLTIQEEDIHLQREKMEKDELKLSLYLYLTRLFFEFSDQNRMLVMNFLRNEYGIDITDRDFKPIIHQMLDSVKDDSEQDDARIRLDHLFAVMDQLKLV